jgi:hypothetical protein
VAEGEAGAGHGPARIAPDATLDDRASRGDAASDAGVDGDGALAEEFRDKFSRPNGGAIGNGWTEKLPAVFDLVAGSVVKRASTTSYRDNMVFRPVSDDRLHVEASVEITIAAPLGYPQVFVRAQRDTLMTTDTYDGYLLYVPDDPASAVLGRQRGTVFVVELAAITISPPLDVEHRYRLRLGARGQSPVELDAYVERQSGDEWLIDGAAHVRDSSNERIDAPGAVGFAANEAATPTYDNFVWRTQPAP